MTFKKQLKKTLKASKTISGRFIMVGALLLYIFLKEKLKTIAIWGLFIRVYEMIILGTHQEEK